MPSKVEDIGVEAFLEENLLSRAVKPFIWAALLPLAFSHGWKNYQEQMPSASRNMEMGIDLFLRSMKHPLKTASVTDAYIRMMKSYSSVQSEIKSSQQYLVYTELDHKIEFRPEEDTLYVYMLVQMAQFGKELADKYTKTEIKEIMKCFLKVNDAGVEVFRNYPTAMPRFTGHNRISLSLAQQVDRPLNCCPSQHIAYSALLYNICKSILELPQRNEKLWHSVETASQKMIPPVLYTKQHSLLDVAFGLHSARRAFEESFSRPFDDLMQSLPEMQSANPDLPYGEIARIYRRGSELFRPEKSQPEKSLADIVGEYLQENNFPLVAPEENNAYFDTGKGEIVKI